MTEAVYASYIYGLVDPRTGQIRYIGKTRRKLKYAVKYRLNRHIADTLKEPLLTHKSRWIASLFREDLLPEAIVIDKVFCSAEELSALERKRIAEYKAKGADLTNATNGGDGGRGPLSEDEKVAYVARLVTANTGAKRGKEARVNMSKGHSSRDPEEWRQTAKKASDAAKVADISDEGRKKISESSSRPKRPETRAKMKKAALRREAIKRGEKHD